MMGIWHTVFETVLKYWIQELFALIIFGFGCMRKSLKRNAKKQSAVESAMLAILRDRIFQTCRYYKAKGEIATDEREVLNTMFQAYIDLGGNGVVKHLKDEMDEINTKIYEVH